MALIESSTTDITLDERLQQLREKTQDYQTEFLLSQQRMRDLANLMDQSRALEKSLVHMQKVDSQSQPDPAPSEQRRKKYEPIAPQIRALIVQNLFYEGSMSWDQVIKTYGVSRASISRILKEEKTKKTDADATVPMKRKRGRKTPIHVDAMIYLCLLLEQDSQLTLQQLVDELYNRFKIESSTSAVDRALAKLDITWKNVLPIPLDWNTIEVINARMQFVKERLLPYMSRPKIYIDEQGFNMHVKRSKGRAVSNFPAVLRVFPKGQRISLIAALSEQGFVHTTQINSLGDKKRGVNATDFQNFLVQLANKIPSGSVLILDNAKIHHAESLDSIWTMLKTTYNIDHVFLPPYSPFINPIEYAFNDLKNEVKSSKFENRGELTKVIEEKIPNVTPQKAQSFFHKAASYYPQLAVGVPFTGKPLDPQPIANEAPTSTSTSVSVSVSTPTTVSLHMLL